MIKAMTKGTKRKCLMLGLSFENLRKFREGPLDTYIAIQGAPFGLDVDIILFSGQTEADMERMLKHDLTGRPLN